MLCITQVFAQNRTVTGTVTAKDDGLPLPGVTVKLKGTNTGVQTGTNGKFTISVPADGTLVFSIIGYVTQSVPVNGKSVLTVVLDVQSQTIGEVVVTGALGIKTQAKQLGYSTATIDSKLLTEGKVTDVSTGLEGKVSGLQVNLTSNGIDPSTRIVLRGNRSLTGNNEALLVVDGVPIEDINGYINTINPEDVANVTVLKGAVAASIYGSKASNGVLIITTKKGTKGKPTISVSNTVSVQAVSYLPDLQTTFGGYGGEGGSFVNANGTVNAVPYENESYGPAFDGHKIEMAITPAAGGGFDTLYTNYANRPNNRLDFFNKALTNQFNFAYDVGDDNSSIHLGFQDVDANGVVPDDWARRDNISVHGTRTIGKFSVEYNATYNQNTVSEHGNSYDQVGTGLFTGNNLYFEVLNTAADIPLRAATLQSTTGPVQYDPTNLNGLYSNVNAYYNAYATNPYWTVQNSRDNRVTYTFQTSVNLSFKITPDLVLSNRIGMDQKTEQLKYTRSEVNFAAWAIADPQSAGNVPSSLKFVPPSEYDETFFEQRLNNDLILQYDKKFGDFTVKALAGSNLEQNYQRDINLQGADLQFAGNYNISSDLGIPGYGEFSFKQREYAFYEDATIGYKGFIYLHGTNRDEWNSVLDPAHDHYEYPGADVSFIFTQAINALKDKDILSYGKISGGLTRVANINLGSGANPYGAYSLQNPFVVPGGFPYGTLGGYAQSNVYLNPLIQPEQTTEYEIGTELGFLKDRINLKFDYYHSDSRNQSLTSVLSSATGFAEKYENAGLITNSGEELDLNVIPLKTSNFSWRVGFNYSHYGNLVKALAPGQSQLLLPGSGSIYAVVGKPYPVIEVQDWVRDPASGKIIVDPVTGQPTVNPNLTTYGTANPTYIYGITNTFTYKYLTLSFVIDARGGNEVFNTVGGTEAFTGISSQSAENGRQRFIFPNSVYLNSSGQYVNNTSVAVDNGNGGQPGSFWSNVYSSPVGSLYVDDAAFVKLREASLSFAIPNKFLSANAPFIKSASIAVVGRNLIMWRPASNTFTDPEFSDTTGNAIGTTSTNQTPPTRYYGGTLTVVF
jgi:TonB-linked SusC/RagA family outer membrane protein